MIKDWMTRGFRRFVSEIRPGHSEELRPWSAGVSPDTLVIGELERILIERYLRWRPGAATEIISDVETILDQSIFLPLPCMMIEHDDHWSIKVNPLSGIHALSVSFTTSSGYEVQTGRLITTNPISRHHREALSNPDRQFRLGEIFRPECIDYDPLVIGCRDAETTMPGEQAPLAIYFQPNFIPWTEFRKEMLRMGRVRLRRRA
ncbi:MAG: hypothetical protein CL949_09475 [Erythrobacter sp.]|nr:hypothetical protein [Erythrobacter sp.]